MCYWLHLTPRRAALAVRLSIYPKICKYINKTSFLQILFNIKNISPWNQNKNTFQKLRYVVYFRNSRFEMQKLKVPCSVKRSRQCQRNNVSHIYYSDGPRLRMCETFRLVSGDKTFAICWCRNRWWWPNNQTNFVALRRRECPYELVRRTPRLFSNDPTFEGSSKKVCRPADLPRGWYHHGYNKSVRFDLDLFCMPRRGR